MGRERTVVCEKCQEQFTYDPARKRGKKRRFCGPCYEEDRSKEEHIVKVERLYHPELDVKPK